MGARGTPGGAWYWARRRRGLALGPAPLHAAAVGQAQAPGIGALGTTPPLARRRAEGVPSGPERLTSREIASPVAEPCLTVKALTRPCGNAPERLLCERSLAPSKGTQHTRSGRPARLSASTLTPPPSVSFLSPPHCPHAHCLPGSPLPRRAQHEAQRMFSQDQRSSQQSEAPEALWDASRELVVAQVPVAQKDSRTAALWMLIHAQGLGGHGTGALYLAAPMPGWLGAGPP